jgi:hypothetical protein
MKYVYTFWFVMTIFVPFAQSEPIPKHFMRMIQALQSPANVLNKSVAPQCSSGSSDVKPEIKVETTTTKNEVVCNLTIPVKKIKKEGQEFLEFPQAQNAQGEKLIFPLTTNEKKTTEKPKGKEITAEYGNDNPVYDPLAGNDQGKTGNIALSFKQGDAKSFFRLLVDVAMYSKILPMEEASSQAIGDMLAKKKYPIEVREVYKVGVEKQEGVGRYESGPYRRMGGQLIYESNKPGIAEWAQREIIHPLARILGTGAPEYNAETGGEWVYAPGAPNSDDDSEDDFKSGGGFGFGTGFGTGYGTVEFRPNKGFHTVSIGAEVAQGYQWKLTPEGQCVVYGELGAGVELEVLGNNPDRFFIQPKVFGQLGMRVDLGDPHNRTSEFEYGNIELIPWQLDVTAFLDSKGEMQCRGSAYTGFGLNLTESCRMEAGLEFNNLLDDPAENNQFEDQDSYFTLRLRMSL